MANLSHINIDNIDIGPDSGEGFSLIPEGKYMAKVIDSKLIPTKAANGHILELTWQIQSGPHERRLIWDKITLIHTSQQAQEIGRKQWKKALRAAGIDHGPQDSSEIHDKLVRIQVKTKPASNGFDASNAISAYYPAPKQADMSQPAQASAPIAGEPQAGLQSTGQAAPPWGGAPGTPPF